MSHIDTETPAGFFLFLQDHLAIEVMETRPGVWVVAATLDEYDSQEAATDMAPVWGSYVNKMIRVSREIGAPRD